jgi:uncharacterized membrane protein YcaP (DUF421 family)
MLEELMASVRDLIGSADGDLAAWQMALRALVIYLTAIVLVRIGQKRFMGKNTAFDMILGIILGSVLSRAITGNAPFGPTIAAGAVLVGLHWLFSVASFHSHLFGSLIKGGERLLIRDGEIHWDNMRKSHLSRKDLEMALRSTGKVTDVADVKLAHFERSGDISVIPGQKDRKLKVVDVAVRDGVQTVRLALTDAD